MAMAILILLVLSCITLLSHAFTNVVVLAPTASQSSRHLTFRPPSTTAASSSSSLSSFVTPLQSQSQTTAIRTTTSTTSTTSLWSSTSSSDDIVWSDATILSNEKACPSGKSVVLQVQVPTTVQEKYQISGQFLQLRLDESTEPLFLAMSSAPNNNDDDSFQFLVKTTTSTDTSWLSNILPNTVVQVSPIMGKGFALTERLARMSDGGGGSASEIILVAAGSGIAPFKACVESGLLQGTTTSRIYYGEWTEDDVSFRNLFTKWEEDDQVTVTPVLSRNTTTNADIKWYVQDAMHQDGIDDPQRTVVLLCGMKPMVEATRTLLQQAGVPQGQILTNF